MEFFKGTDIDELVRARLLRTGGAIEKEQTKAVEVGTPTLDTPPTDDVNPMEWLTNPVGLDLPARRKVTWAETGEIVSPLTRLHAAVPTHHSHKYAIGKSKRI